MVITLVSLLLAVNVDPLAPAREGLVQCYDPVPADKLCRAIGAYEFSSDGSIVNLGMNRIQDALPVIMFSRSAAEVRDGKICSIGPLTEADIYRVDVAGQTLDEATLMQARARIAGAFPPATRSGALCSAHTANADGSLTTTVDIDGVPHPEIRSTVRWVRPDAGWSVIP